ncbi:MAG: alpha/beta hydrolase [Planctomycetes bacterium]|nr:alpha/beta hydrolase [Planctomycetota bacterium]MBL7107527.1 alpha/beta hydrolase [Phycisphaerae bacterium]
MRSLKLLVVVLVMCYALTGCGKKEDEYRVMDEAIIKVKEALKPLGDFSGDYPDEVTDYFKFYGLDADTNNVEHIFGTFKSGEFTLIGHIYKPAEYKATVFLLHGYFDHCGQLNFLIKYLLESGYAVAAFDLPGHGLSSGQRGSIDDFAQYSRALTDFADKVKPQLKPPYHFVGHSTGAAAVIDYLLTNKNPIFDRIVLAAPLVHCAAWEQSKIGYNEKIQFIKSVPRVFRKNSSSSDFLDFIKNKDTLQTRTIPLKWVRALHKWNEKIADSPLCNKPVKIIQGSKDTTIDWRFNIKFLQAKFSNAEVSQIKNANHELFNESDDIRNEVFLGISDYLAF